MAETPSTDIAIMLGEMRGQLREVVHTSNNTAAKIDSMAREVAEMKGITRTIAALEQRVSVVETDVTALKTERSERNGATSALATIWKNLPSAAAMLIGVVAIALIVLKVSGRMP